MSLQVEYKEHPEFPGYRIGNDGSVWSCWSFGAKPRQTNQWRQMKANRQRYGHLVVSLRGGACKLVHRLVLEVFVGPCPEGMVCRHLNGNAGDNSVGNLTWGTQLDNIADAVAHGTKPKGAQLWQSKFTVEIVKEIMARAQAGEDLLKVARSYGVTKAAVRAVLNGLSWNHVTGIERPKAYYDYRAAARIRERRT